MEINDSNEYKRIFDKELFFNCFNCNQLIFTNNNIEKVIFNQELICSNTSNNKDNSDSNKVNKK